MAALVKFKVWKKGSNEKNKFIVEMPQGSTGQELKTKLFKDGLFSDIPIGRMKLSRDAGGLDGVQEFCNEDTLSAGFQGVIFTLEEEGSTLTFGSGSTSDILSDLEKKVDSVYSTDPELCNVFQGSMDIPVAMTLEWGGREEAIDQLNNSWNQTIEARIQEEKTKQNYVIPVVAGPMGIGKSRLVVEAWKLFQQCKYNYADKFSHIGNLFLDFSLGGDPITTLELELMTPDQQIGGRILAGCFFGKKFSFVRSLFKMEEYPLLKLSNVLSLIHKRFTSQGQVLLMIQLDEFQEVKNFKELLHPIAEFMRNEHKYKICLLPVLSGTDEVGAVFSLSLSSLTAVPLLLHALSLEQCKNILAKSQVWGQGLLTAADKFLQISLEFLGGIPRHLYEFSKFAASFQLHANSDRRQGFQDVLLQTTNRIKIIYSLTRWSKALNSNEEDYTAVINMCMWALSNRKVKMNDKLNGINIADAVKRGILFLNHGNTINLPLVTLRGLNSDLGIIPHSDWLFDPFYVVNDKQFEYAATTIRALRGSLYVHSKEDVVTYAQLYPGAIGRTSVLNRKVVVTAHQVKEADGKSARHESIHKLSPTKIVLSPSGSVVDYTKGDHMIINVAMAPSFDACCYHPSRNGIPACHEVLQIKSSDYIKRGQPPPTSGAATLKLGSEESNVKKTIWSEYHKISEEEHRKFYRNTEFTFVIISNKYLENYDKIMQDPENTLPPNTIVICNQNFEQFASKTFANSISLFIAAEEEKETTIPQTIEGEQKGKIKKRKQSTVNGDEIPTKRRKQSTAGANTKSKRERIWKKVKEIQD